MRKSIIFIVFIISVPCLVNTSFAQGKINDFNYKESFNAKENSVQNEFHFNGYTRYWHGTHEVWTRYGNLFKLVTPNIWYSIAQSKLEAAKDLRIPGLSMQEGFFKGLFEDPYVIMDQPSIDRLDEYLKYYKKNNVLVTVDPDSETGKALTKRLTKNTDNPLEEMLEREQSASNGVIGISAFVLENDTRKIFVISSSNEKYRNRLKDLVINTEVLLKEYDMKRGWFGIRTGLKSVSVSPGHPLEIIGKGLNEGNSWFVFDGYTFLAKEELEKWAEEVNLPVVTDVGYSPIYGLENYDSLQVQSMFTPDSWIQYAHNNGGYAFRDVYDNYLDSLHLDYDGFFATEGNKEQIDDGDLPFVSKTGDLESGLGPFMVLFVKKNNQFTKKQLWEAILQRREVSILDQGRMVGSSTYRDALEILLLDRIFIEEYFGDRINMEASTTGYQLNVTVTNTYSHPVSGQIIIDLPSQLKFGNHAVSILNIPPNSSKSILYEIQPDANAMDKTNPIAVHYKWDGGTKSTLAILDLPPAISVHHLLYGHSPKIRYPVTIHNFERDTSFPVKVEVMKDDKTAKVVFKTEQICIAQSGTFKDLMFELNVPPGKYNVKVSALGAETVSQLGVGKNTGVAKVSAVDLNNDGINEYRMENDSVQITLLTTGARVIEYIVKSRNDNVLFKLWPEKPSDDKRPFRKRAYYPYGGFEDFLGQPSIETFENYNAEISKEEGDYVQVKMTADYYGNKIEKIFTLYGNSPLLEIRFALTFKNPELNVFGPQPMLALGEKHGPEDIFTFPEMSGMRQYRMDMEKYYGRIIHLKEGWNADYDSKEDITFVGAFPVDQHLFLHLWMNHPDNRDSHYYYAELQPWTPIFQKSTMYFSYYLWGSGGSWEEGVRSLRERNLISHR